jgi:hypothetical protein
MNSQRFQRVSEIFHAALDHPAEHRAAFLKEVCSGDSGLLHEVESLLVA